MSNHSRLSVQQKAIRAAWQKRHIWLLSHDLKSEFQQAHEEGRDLSSVEAQFKQLIGKPWSETNHNAANDLLDRIQHLPLRRDYPYREPSDLAGIQKACPPQPSLAKWHGNRKEFLRRLHGGLLGRIAGCMLGKPVEGWDRNSIRITCEALGNWPMTNYLRLPTAKEAEQITRQKPKRTLNQSHLPMMLDGMNGMIEDDDINYTTSGMAIVKQWGAKFTPLDVATFWLENIPIFHTFTAERVAYRNIVAGILPPQSASFRNPHREWIGAQIRADFFGYANPGNPERAAEWAWRDASVSHIKNGIYGEMWVAAMLAAAYVETDWVKIIRAGLAQIPAKCRLRESIEQIITLHTSGADYEEAVALVHRQWDEATLHGWCHTISNAQLVTIGLLYGEDDYTHTISRAVMGAFDTDCNGATCGSLWGVKHSVDKIPSKWTRPLKDLVRTGVAGFHEVRISKLAETMVEVAEKTRE